MRLLHLSRGNRLSGLGGGLLRLLLRARLLLRVRLLLLVCLSLRLGLRDAAEGREWEGHPRNTLILLRFLFTVLVLLVPVMGRRKRGIAKHGVQERAGRG